MKAKYTSSNRELVQPIGITVGMLCEIFFIVIKWTKF